MEALLQKKRDWEFQNQLVLNRVGRLSITLFIESVKAAGLFISFLLFLIYAFGYGVYALIRGMLAPRLIRRIGPNCKPEEFHEFNYKEPELHLRSRPNSLIR